MIGIDVWLFRFVFVVLVGWFATQMLQRVRLVIAGTDNLSVDDVPRRIDRFVSDVVFQRRVIAAKPIVGLAHLFVFWGFCAFGLYTLVELVHGLGIADFTDARWFRAYQVALVPFAVAVLVGILFLVIRRGVFRPASLGATVSKESLMIGGFIVTLMVTFLLDYLVFGHQATAASRANWWVHMVLILLFLALIPDSKHLHLLVSPLTVFLKSNELQTVPNLDFEREEVGFEAVKDLPRKARLDAFTCVECGRCQENCPAFATGKALNPKSLILAAESALLAGRESSRLVEVFDEGVLWQCTTCGACENQCPVGVEHTPIIIGARRGLVSNGEAAEYLGKVFNTLERHQNIWGPGQDSRQKFISSAGCEIFDAARHEYLVWLGCAGALEADFQRSLRALFGILRTYGVTFGVLPRERCTGDVAKRSGNEFMFQELATQNVDDMRARGVTKILTSCPHCLKTLGHDYRNFGFEAEVTHSSVLVARLTASTRRPGEDHVTYHDPCYLGRYAGVHEEPRQLLERFGASLAEPDRNRDNPFCCGAGGGLLFEEHESGRRISDQRFEQLAATGAPTVVVGCPFCSIMLKGAAASANAPTGVVDLMTWVEGRLLGEATPRAGN